MELSCEYKKRWDMLQNNIGFVLKTYLPFQNMQLEMMQGDLSNIPNVLLYGIHGFPLEILWKEALKRRFQTDGFTEKQCMWGKGLPYTETPYYIRFDMANPDIPNDLEPLQELLKAVIRTTCIHSERHIIVIDNIDHFINRSTNRHMFRVLLERFSKNAWFICSTYHINRLESPLQSRFYCIRFPLPSEKEVDSIMAYIDGNNTTETYLTRNIIQAIASPRNRDIEKQWMSSLFYPPLGEFIGKGNGTKIEDMRAIVYKAFQSDVTISEFVQDIIRICIRRGDHEDIIHNILKEFASCEHMASQSKGTRILLYMEYMLHYAMLLEPDQKKKALN